MIINNSKSQDLVKQFLMRAKTLEEKVANQSEVIAEQGRRLEELESYIDQLEANKTGMEIM